MWDSTAANWIDLLCLCLLWSCAFGISDGLAPVLASQVHSERIAYKLAMQSLGRSLRSELGEFCIPVCLAAPIGSEEPLPSAEPTVVPPPSPPSGLIGSLTGLGRVKPTLSEYARHVVSGMLEGAPYATHPRSSISLVRLLHLPPHTPGFAAPAHRRYILAPGGDGILSSKAVGGARCCLGGYANLSPAIMVMHTLTMPMVRGWILICRTRLGLPFCIALLLLVFPLRSSCLSAQLSLLDTGMPILWREVAARWWHGNALKKMAKSYGRYTALRDDSLAA